MPNEAPTVPQSQNTKILADHVLITGKNDANATIIFVPGGPGLSFDYLPDHFRVLGKSFRLVFYNPGFERNFDRPNLASLADELHGLRERFGKNIGFVAHSGGALILLEYFKKYGPSPAALISWVTDMGWIETYYRENDAAKDAEKRLQASLDGVDNPEEALRRRMVNYVDDYFPPATREEGKDLLNRIRYFPSVADAIEGELAAGASEREVFLCSGAPILGLAGDKDRIVFPSYLKQLCADRHIPIELRFIENAGHFGFVDNSEQYNSYMSKFFSDYFNGGDK